MDDETLAPEVDYDTSFSSAISGSKSNSAASVSGKGCSDITVSKTQKTESPELSLLEVFENLEREEAAASAAAGGDGGVSESSKMDFPAVMQLLEDTDGVDNTPNMKVSDIVNLLEVFETFEKENAGYKSLIEEAKNENTKLSLELESMKEREIKSHEKHMKDVNSLRTQIASLKLNLQNSDAERSLAETASFQKAEFDQLQTESIAKSKEIMELTKEITNLRKSALVRPRSAVSAPGKPLARHVGFDEKEAEYQKDIKRLQKQVRTLQRILYSKESGVPPIPFGGASSGNKEENNGTGVEPSKEVVVLESRISELETALADADSEAKANIKEFQQQLSSLRENERKSQEKHKDEANRLKEELAQIKAAYDNGPGSLTAILQAEVDQLKSEVDTKSKQITRLNSEISKLKNSRLRGRGDSAQSVDKTTAALLEEKDVQHQKEVRKLENQVRTLQRILYHKDPSSLPPVMNRANPSKPVESSNKDKERQAALEARIVELESQLQLHSMQEKLGLREEGDVSKGKSMEMFVGELRARLIAQMKLVTCLKDHLGASKSQVVNLQNEKGLLEFRVRELSQELTLAKTLSKPENDILTSLTETVQNLSSRYFYREKELDTLITHLSVKNLTSSAHLPLPPMISNSISAANPIDERQLALLLGNDFHFNGSSALSQGHGMELGIFSPTTAMQLLGEPVDEFLFSKR